MTDNGQGLALKGADEVGLGDAQEDNTMSTGTLTLLYLGQGSRAHHPPPKV